MIVSSMSIYSVVLRGILLRLQNPGSHVSSFSPLPGSSSEGSRGYLDSRSNVDDDQLSVQDRYPDCGRVRLMSMHTKRNSDKAECKGVNEDQHWVAEPDCYFIFAYSCSLNNAVL